MKYWRRNLKRVKLLFSATLLSIPLILALLSLGASSAQVAEARQEPTVAPSKTPTPVLLTSDFASLSQIDVRDSELAQPINASVRAGGRIAWIPVRIGPPDSAPSSMSGQEELATAEDSSTEIPIPGSTGAIGEATGLLAPLPNLKYYNAPNGSFYVTPWSNIHWGDSVTVYWGVRNNGTANISNGTRFDWRFYLSTNNYISTSDYAWYTLYRTIGLSAGYYTSGDFTRICTQKVGLGGIVRN